MELLAKLSIVNVRCLERLTELLKALTENDLGYCEAWKVCMEQCVASDGKCFERDDMDIQQFQY